MDPNTWLSKVKRIRGKKQPLSSAGVHALRDDYTRTTEPARLRCGSPPACPESAVTSPLTISSRVEWFTVGLKDKEHRQTNIKAYEYSQ